MRPLQISEIATLTKVKRQEGQVGVFTGDASVVSMALVGVVEEASQSLGQHLMVVLVLDEAVLGVIGTFATEQGASGEVAKDLDNDIVHDVG